MSQTHDRKTYAIFERSRNKKIIAELEKNGASVLKIKPADLIKNDSLPQEVPLENIGQFDWLVISDVDAAEFFLETLTKNDFDLFEIDDLHVCALGEAVAERLRLSQIHTDVIPVANQTEKIVESIENYIFGTEKIAGKKFLLVKETSENFEFVETLRQKNAQIFEVASYRAELVSSKESAKIKALIKGGAVDEIIFTTPEDLTHLRILFQGENLIEILRGTKISGFDEATRQTLLENQIEARIFLRFT